MIRKIRQDRMVRTASIAAAATTEEAPKTSPTGCRRKRDIITYAKNASKA